jgi:hypothetical protein
MAVIRKGPHVTPGCGRRAKKKAGARSRRPFVSCCAAARTSRSLHSSRSSFPPRTLYRCRSRRQLVDRVGVSTVIGRRGDLRAVAVDVHARARRPTPGEIGVLKALDLVSGCRERNAAGRRSADADRAGAARAGAVVVRDRERDRVAPPSRVAVRPNVTKWLQPN